MALLRSIQKKKRYNIAFNEDIYKVKLEVIIAQENPLELKNQLKNMSRRILQLLGLNFKNSIIPISPKFNLTINDIERTINNYKGIRSYKILAENKKNFILAKDIAKRALMPQLNFFLGYRSIGQDYNLKNRQDSIYGGISTRLNFNRQFEKADYNVKIIDLKRAGLNLKKNLFNLRLHLLELQINIKKQKIRIEYASRKLVLSQKILRAETRNYRIGRNN